MGNICAQYKVTNISQTITVVDLDCVRQSWSIIVDTPTESFLRAQRNEKFDSVSSLSWFYELFYGRLFELYPYTLQFFGRAGFIEQGRLISTIISGCLQCQRVPFVLKQYLRPVIEPYALKGAKVDFFIAMGSSLHWALGHVLDTQLTVEARKAWSQIYNYVLHYVIMPIVNETRKKWEKKIGQLWRKQSTIVWSSSSMADSERINTKISYKVQTEVVKEKKIFFETLKRVTFVERLSSVEFGSIHEVLHGRQMLALETDKSLFKSSRLNRILSF